MLGSQRSSRRRSRAYAHALGVCWLVLVCVGAGTSARSASTSLAPGQPPARRQPTIDARALDAFTDALNEYVALHRRLEKTLPPLPKQAAPTVVHAHELALAKLIATARPGAKEGAIFVAAVQPELRRICRELLTGPDGPALLETIREESAERAIQVRINERYPDEVPLSAVPYQLLKALPALPEELEYRFHGRHLMLLDANARMVVDLLRDVIPR